MTRPVLALDLATRTGWALRDASGRVTSGVQEFALRRGESPGMRWIRFRAWLVEVLSLGGLSHQTSPRTPVLAYEQSLAVHRGGHAAALAHGLTAIVQEEAAARGVEVTSIAPSALKKHATGRGNAKKPEVLSAARARWGRGEDLADDNEADALCILAWVLEEIGEGEAEAHG